MFDDRPTAPLLIFPIIKLPSLHIITTLNEILFCFLVPFYYYQCYYGWLDSFVLLVQFIILSSSHSYFLRARVALDA